MRASYSGYERRQGFMRRGMLPPSTRSLDTPEFPEYT